jgi:glutaredoxin/glutathione-dependent peroxiredoxin
MVMITNRETSCKQTCLKSLAPLSPSNMASAASRTMFRSLRPAAQSLRPAASSVRARPMFVLRRGFATPTSTEQPRIRLGSIAPNFTAKTTHGNINFHSFIDNSWAILFSHPADFTPVCTTELGAFAKLKDEFEKRGVKMIGLSANDLDSHDRWIQDINDISKTSLQFPIIADADRKVAWLYDMVDAQDLSNIDEKGIAFTIRSVFVIDPDKKVRLTMMYPASTGRNTSEVLRVIDSLQTGDKKGVTTPIDWQMGDDVIVPPSVSTPDAKKKFQDVREVRPYLRFTSGETKA